MRRTTYNSVRVAQTLAPAALRTAGAVNGTTVDRYVNDVYYKSATVVVHSGAITDGTHTVTLEESDNGSAWSTVAAADMQGSPPAITPTDDTKVYEVGYVGSKRYIRAVLTTGTAATGGFVDAVVILGVQPVKRP